MKAQNTFGWRLKVLRTYKGLTQEELAEMLGVTRYQIYNYESANREPKFETVIKIADIFNVSIDYLLRGRDKYLYMVKESELDILPYLVKSDDDLRLMEDVSDYIWFLRKHVYKK